MAKGMMVMGNRKFTSDMVGSLDFGSSSTAANLDRKGGSIMSNRKFTSDLVGGSSNLMDIIGAELAAAPQVQPKVPNVADQAKHAAAALKIDDRIVKVLKPECAAHYLIASSTKSKGKFLAAAVKTLLAMVSDQGVSGMVTSVAEVDKEFGGVGILQRAMARRLAERDSYMSRGWLTRLFKKEEDLSKDKPKEKSKDAAVQTAGLLTNRTNRMGRCH